MTGGAPQAGWYPDPSDSSRRRFWDGRTWGQSEPTDLSSKAPFPKAKRRALLILVAVVALFFAVVALSMNHKQPSGGPSSMSAAPSSVSGAPATGIGQEACDGNFSFVVNSVDRSKTAGDPSIESETVTAQGEFLNVHITVSNVGDQAQSFFAANQKLSIGGRDFSSNGPAAMWVGSMTVEIKPGSSVQAVVSFDVSPNSADNGALTVHDSAFSPGAKISLESGRQQQPLGSMCRQQHRDRP